MRVVRAFTLIELLVVIAIIGVLVSVLLPALGKARASARMARELSAARQLMTAFSLYANDNSDSVLVGYPTADMVAGPMDVRDAEGERMQGEEAQRYPWRIAPYLGFEFRGGMYSDDRLLQKLKDEEGAYTTLGHGYEYVVSLFPSLGMNMAFVGGSAHRDHDNQFGPIFRGLFGKPYVERMHEAARPSELITFASARTEVQSLAPTIGAPEGYFRVEPPVYGLAQGRRWAAAYDPKAEHPGANSGYVSLRHNQRAVVANFDTHAAMLGWEALGDMRRWCDKADSATWGLAPR